ncbi:MAG: crossover junction endodeoxyribonuclease RuvC [Spirochaetia bacterium]|nr:crossover junction endodeoxyribonuclease RuvC [Spirochaetia bacterium]
MVRILGIDPGLAQTGWGIVDYADCRYSHVIHGVIQTPSDADISCRLELIYDRLDKILNMYKPSEAGIESIFFARNVLSAIPVAHAKGVIHLLCAQKKITAVEYTPLQIKQAIVGSGRAEKKQVQSLVKLLLKLEKIPEPDHASDALAAAICHCNNRGFLNV